MCLLIIEMLFVITLTQCLLGQADTVAVDCSRFKIITSGRQKCIGITVFLSIIKMQIGP